MFRLLKLAAKKRNPIQRGARLEFRLFSVTRGLIVLALVINVFFTLLTLEAVVSVPDDPFYLPLIFFVIFIGVLLASPAPIFLDESGMRQHYWWRRDKFIPWNDVVEAVHEPETDRTVVRGKWGTCISFSPLLIGQDRFEREILAHSDLGEILEYI